MDRIPTKARKPLLIAGLIAAPLFLFWLLFVNYVEVHEVGIARNAMTGDLWLQKDAGFYLTPPWVRVACIETRPQRVCVTSASRGFNCKLVQFEPAHFRELVDAEGFRYYWWDNRISVNFGHTEEYRGVRNLLRGYGYDVVERPFITVLKDYEAVPVP